MISKDHFNGKESHNFCKKPELIENYDKAIADECQVWECHHRLETHTSDGERRKVDLKRDELIALGVYYNRPPEELVFITPKEHRKLHNLGKSYCLGHVLTEEHKNKISEAHRSTFVYYKCVETGEVRHLSKWTRDGYKANEVASGKRKSSKGCHFVKVLDERQQN